LPNDTPAPPRPLEGVLRFLYPADFRPDNFDLVSTPLAEKVYRYKAELIGLLSLGVNMRRCERGHWLDSRDRCWRCCERGCCHCSRPTGSALIELCATCGRDFGRNRGEPL
jgi:hypothetical protein